MKAIVSIKNIIYSQHFLKNTFTMTTATGKGKIVQIIGPVIDVRFEGTTLPNILDALEVTKA